MLWKSGERDGDPLNLVEFVAKNMTDDQIRAVSRYSASLRPEEVTPQDDSYTGLDQAGSTEAQRKFVPPEVEFAPANRADGSESE